MFCGGLFFIKYLYESNEILVLICSNFSYIVIEEVRMKLSEMTEEKSKTSSKKKTIHEAYEELKGCSSDELMERLTKEISGQKMNGTFDYEALRESIEKIKTYLPTQTYENMIRIIESLK